MLEDGIIQFTYNLQRKALPVQYKQYISTLNHLRETLYKLKLIGVNSQGLGYGNVSARVNQQEFLITASQTGHLKRLTDENYTLITNYNLDATKVTAIGLNPPSSESLTHAALYQIDPVINYVVHIHNLKMWNYFKKEKTATPANATYGTKDLALAMQQLFYKPNDSWVLSGHREGLIYFATDHQKILEMILQDFHIVFQ